MDPIIVAVTAVGVAAALATLARIITTLLSTPTACQCGDCTGWAWYAARMRATPACPAARHAVYTGLRREVR